MKRVLACFGPFLSCFCFQDPVSILLVLGCFCCVFLQDLYFILLLLGFSDLVLSIVSIDNNGFKPQDVGTGAQEHRCT
jgi:hypothetical protein